MPMAQNQWSSMGATRINVGLSAIIKIPALAYEVGSYLKIISGGGTLEIVNSPAALSGSSATGWGAGYPVGASEIINVAGPAFVYLAASGATMVVGLATGYTNGATVV